MAAMTAAQQTAVVRYWGNATFVQANATANFSTADILAAVQAADAILDTHLTTLNAALPAPFSGATAAQKTMLLCHLLMKRAGII